MPRERGISGAFTADWSVLKHTGKERMWCFAGEAVITTPELNCGAFILI